MTQSPSHHVLWYISKYVAPPVGSAPGGRGYELVKELAARGHDCVIITSDANHLAEVPKLESPVLVQKRDGLTMAWLRTFKSPRAKSSRRMLSWIHFEWRLLTTGKKQFPRPDTIVVSSLSLLTILTGLWFRRKFACRLVFEVRDIWPLTIVEEDGFSPANPLVVALQFLERLGYRYADAIVGTMPNLGEHVEEILGRPRPTYCIPMGVVPARTSQEARLPEGYRESFLSSGRFTIGYAGTVGITNALEPFFLAAEALEGDDSIQFVLVGDGDMLADYSSRFGQLSNLTFAPKVPRAAVPLVLQEFDVLYFSVHNSKVWKYGMSLNKVIDYMLAGKPILASYDGFPSMIDEACCGSFVPAASVEPLVDEIRRYRLMSPLERLNLGARGREWLVANRRYDRLASQYEQVLFPAPSSA